MSGVRTVTATLGSIAVLLIVLACGLKVADFGLRFMEDVNTASSHRVDLLREYARLCSDSRDQMFKDVERQCIRWNFIIKRYEQRGVYYIGLMRRLQAMGFCGDELCDDAFSNIADYVWKMVLCLLGLIVIFCVAGAYVYTRMIIPFLSSGTVEKMTLPGVEHRKTM